MERKIREYIESQFSAAGNNATAAELQEEIIKNTIERYHDLLGEGKTEEQAYGAAIDSVGDLNELISELGGGQAREIPAEPVYTEEQSAQVKTRRRMFVSIAVALYIVCVTPTILLSNTFLSDISPALMFWIISFATALLVYSRVTKYLPLEGSEKARAQLRRRGIMRGAAIGLFISCVTPPILLASTVFSAVSAAFMFIMIAAGVVLIILSKGGKRGEKPQLPPAQTVRRGYGAPYIITVVCIWLAVSVSFIALVFCLPYSISTSWLLFPLGGALHGLTRALFDYFKGEEA